MKFVPVILACLLAGCTLTVPHEIISAGPSTYIASSGGGPYTQDSGAVRQSAYKAANEFCATKGLVMVPISEREQPYHLGRSTASISLTFKALTKEEAARYKEPVVVTVVQ